MSTLLSLPGSELFRDPSLGMLERWYCRLLGVPIVGLRIRLRCLQRLLPPAATRVLDAGCGKGVISRMLAHRYPAAKIDAIDQDEQGQRINQEIAEACYIANCRFQKGDLTTLDSDGEYDLIVSVDNLEHIENDVGVLQRFYRAMQANGILVVHVPHYYRRWPVFRWSRNFDVPGHVRPGYHLPELIERVRKAGFIVQRSGFSYGFLENLANNIGYAISAAEQKNRILYALLFPLLNLMAWLGQGGHPGMGAGVWCVAQKSLSEAKREPNHRSMVI
ncbi:MAG: class I SAM-dependent methyltransferase [Gammaproteobacteria bacterium]|nr:class I SAM-dependent methyltransferase [Gammaproteobacteria bacterium]